MKADTTDQEASPNAVMVEGTDDVAVLLVPVQAGMEIRYQHADAMRCLAAAQDIPAYHKAALRAIHTGEAVRKYGERIGIATRDIAAGAHVHTHNLRSAQPGEDA